MEVILAVIRPKQNVSGQDYRAKYYDILLLDHKNVDKHGKPTKYLPAFPLKFESEPRDEILTHLYTLTGGDLGGIKGERALVIPWSKKESYRESLSRFCLYCIPVGIRDKLNSNFVDKSPNSPGFYSLDNLIHSLNSSSMNFPPPTRTFVTHIESWLKEKHAKPGALDVVFRSRTDFRIKMTVSNPGFLPVNMGLSDNIGLLRNEFPQDIQFEASGAFAKMSEIEKCTRVVTNSLFGSGLVAKPRKHPVWPSPDYHTYDSNTTSRKSSLNSSIDPDTYSLAERELYPLHIYAAKGDVLKVQDCIVSGYPMSKRDTLGWTPIHYAAFYGFHDIVNMLLNASCSPNVLNSDDRTPLHLAAIKGFPSVVNVLLNHPEVDMNLVDKKGRTALEMCEQKLSWEHIVVARRLETAARQPRQIKVLVSDSTSNNLNLVDGANTSVQQLNQQMLREYNMPEIPFADIFTIWICSPSLELQLKPEHKPIEHMNNWKRRIVNMLTDGDPKEEEPHLKWRRNAKISLIVEREVIHPDAIKLLFHEARQNYINALYPCKEQDVLLFASILLYMNHGGYDLPAAKTFLSKDKNLQLLVPAPMLRLRSNWTNRIINQYKEFSSLLAERNDARFRTTQALQNQFLNSCRNLTVYGSAFFTGTIQVGNSRQPKECYIGVNDVGMHIINSQTRVMLHSYKYSEISWGLSVEYGILDVNIVRNESRAGNHSPRNALKLRTKQAGMINHLMRKLSHITYGIVTRSLP